MGKVFISFASHDSATATALCSKMEQNGVRCWIAPRDVIPGQDYAGLITHAIREADAFILVLSEASYSSAHVLNELSLAFDRQLNIIPYCIDSSTPQDSFCYYLATKHRINSTGDIDQDVNAILLALKQGRVHATPPAHASRSMTWAWCAAAVLVLCGIALFTLKRTSGTTELPAVAEISQESTIEMAVQEDPETEDEARSEVLVVNEKSHDNPTPRERAARTEDGFASSLSVSPSPSTIDYTALKELEDGIFLYDRGRYISDNVRCQTYFRKEGDGLEALVDSSHLTESVKTLLTWPEASDGITMKIIQHKYGFKTETFERPLCVVLASCIAAGCKPYVGIDSANSSSIVASLFMVNIKDDYTHVFKVVVPAEVIRNMRGTISADLNAYSPLTDSDSLFQDS